MNTSDRRIKQNIVDATPDESYTIIQGLRVRKYEYTDNYRKSRHNNPSTGQVWGLIAQEVEQVFPEAVTTSATQTLHDTTAPTEDADGDELPPTMLESLTDFKQLDKQKLLFPMLGAIQKLMLKVEALEASNAALLTRVASLEAQST